MSTIGSGTTRGGELNPGAHDADACPECAGDVDKAVAHGEALLKAAGKPGGFESRVSQGG